MQSIGSIKDSRVVHARSLSAAVGRRRSQECLLFGAHQIRWALDAGLQIDSVFFVQRCEQNSLIDFLESKGISVLEVSAGIIKKITATNFIIPIVGIAHVHVGRAEDLPQDKLVLVFDRVIQYQNAGAMVRNAQSFGVRNVVIADETGGDVFYRGLIESSHGAVFSSSIHSFQNPMSTVSALKEKGYRILVSAQGVKPRGSLFDIQHSPTALVISAEWAEIRQDFVEAADVVLIEPVMPCTLNAEMSIEGLSVLKLRMVLALLSEHLNKNITQHPGYLSFMLVHVFQRELAKVTELSLPHIFLLMDLIAARVLSCDILEKKYLLKKDGVNEFVQPLIVRGLVERFGAPLFEGLRITLRGEELLERCWVVVEYVQAILFKDFSSHECHLLGGFFERLMNNSRML